MPTVSEPQKRLMLAVDHGWHKPGGGGPSRAVAHEFVEADKKAGRVMSNKGYSGSPTKYAQGGPVLQTSNSRFMKTPDSFSTDKQPSNYASKSKPKGTDKSVAPVKPQKSGY